MDAKIKQIISQLTNEQKEILIDTGTKSGDISVTGVMGGKRGREKAIFNESMEMFLKESLIYDDSNNGEFLSLTSFGWKVSNELKTG